MTEAAPPSACVVLVPAHGLIDPGCEDALRELERRGYAVWRVRGYSQVEAFLAAMHGHLAEADPGYPVHVRKVR